MGSADLASQARIRYAKPSASRATGPHVRYQTACCHRLEAGYHSEAGLLEPVYVGYPEQDKLRKATNISGRFQATARNGSRAFRDIRVRRRTLVLIRAVSNSRTGSLRPAWLRYCAYASDALRSLGAPDDDVQVGAVMDQCSLGTGITAPRASESDTLRRGSCSCNYFTPSCGSKGARLHHPAPSTTCAASRTTTVPASRYAEQHVRSRVNTQPWYTALCTGSRALNPHEESWLKRA